jgi:hypothetical protein
MLASFTMNAMHMGSVFDFGMGPVQRVVCSDRSVELPPLQQGQDFVEPLMVRIKEQQISLENLNQRVSPIDSIVAPHQGSTTASSKKKHCQWQRL